MEWVNTIAQIDSAENRHTVGQRLGDFGWKGA